MQHFQRACRGHVGYSKQDKCVWCQKVQGFSIPNAKTLGPPWGENCCPSTMVAALMVIPREVVWCHTHPRGDGSRRAPVSSGHWDYPSLTQTDALDRALIMVGMIRENGTHNMLTCCAFRSWSCCRPCILDIRGVIPDCVWTKNEHQTSDVFIFPRRRQRPTKDWRYSLPPSMWLWHHCMRCRR